MYTGYIFERGVLIPSLIIFGAVFTLLLFSLEGIAFVWGVLFTFFYLFSFTLWLSVKYSKDKMTLETFFQSPQKLFRIRIPPHEEYDPLMMEYVINALPTTIDSKNNPGLQFSFEIVSHEGAIYFFVRTPEEYTEHIQNAFKTAFPSVLIEETDATLASLTPFFNNTYKMKGFEWNLGNKDNFVSIRTYKDMGKKEGAGVDTLGLLFYLCDSLTVGEHIFFQVVVRGNIFDATNKNKNKIKDLLGVQTDQKSWEDLSKEAIQAVILKHVIQVEDGKNTLDDFVKEQIKQMREKSSHQTYQVGVRAVYVAKENSYRTSLEKQIQSLFEPLNVFGYNPIVSSDILFDEIKAHEYRMFFQPPLSEKRGRLKKIKDHFILSASEIVTLFHLPPPSIPVTSEHISQPQVPRDIPL